MGNGRFPKGHRANVKHGHATDGDESPTYKTWAMMLQRCNNKNHTSYANYGGRGVKVHPRWWAFKSFLADMGERPAGMTLDRIDNDGHYEPVNCRWITNTEQCRNTRKNRNLTHNGETHCVSEWAEILGIKEETLYARVTKLGWSVKEALTTPVQRYVRKGVDV